MNRVTAGQAKIGSLYLGGSQITATSTELNGQADLSSNGSLSRVSVVTLTQGGSSAEVDAAYDLPSLALIDDVFVEITAAASAGATIDVGLLSSSSGGDADGFIDAASAATTGILVGVATVSTSAGAGYEFFISTTRGALLQKFNAGSSAATGVTGTAYDIRHRSDSVTAKSLSFTLSSTGTSAFRGRAIIRYTELSS